eukprot:Phypoly_transcript_22031.p1 GENE.Phypoly_transcript_22031~~Phypoly_transcript_22031.p1  ORF type:complete len:201 (+),score=17.48 Phypoly_transcript_22031:49-603(+)
MRPFLVPNSFSTHPMSFTIREANIEDIPLIVPIWMEGQKSLNKSQPLSSRGYYEQHFLALFQRTRSSPNHNFWVAAEDIVDGSATRPNILGWIAVVPYSSSPLFYTTTGLASIYIAPNHKNMGIGKRFVEVLSVWTKEHLQWMLVEVRIGNTASERLCESYGFKPLGEVSTTKRMWCLQGKANL